MTAARADPPSSRRPRRQPLRPPALLEARARHAAGSSTPTPCARWRTGSWPSRSPCSATPAGTATDGSSAGRRGTWTSSTARERQPHRREEGRALPQRRRRPGLRPRAARARQGVAGRHDLRRPRSRSWPRRSAAGLVGPVVSGWIEGGTSHEAASLYRSGCPRIAFGLRLGIHQRGVGRRTFGSTTPRRMSICVLRRVPPASSAATRPGCARWSPPAASSPRTGCWSPPAAARARPGTLRGNR